MLRESWGETVRWIGLSEGDVKFGVPLAGRTFVWQRARRSRSTLESSNPSAPRIYGWRLIAVRGRRSAASLPKKGAAIHKSPNQTNGGFKPPLIELHRPATPPCVWAEWALSVRF